MAHLLGGESLHLEFPTRTIFEGITVGLNEGDRIGIVGRNGDGKSTLMKILAYRLEPDSYRVTVRGGTRIGYLDQSDVLDDDHTVGYAIVGDTPEYEWARNPVSATSSRLWFPICPGMHPSLRSLAVSVDA